MHTSRALAAVLTTAALTAPTAATAAGGADTPSDPGGAQRTSTGPATPPGAGDAAKGGDSG